VRVVTHLSSFRGNSRFLTWVYRIAVNYLISARRSRVEAQGLTFEQFASDLADGLSDASAGSDERPADKAVRRFQTSSSESDASRASSELPHSIERRLGQILGRNSSKRFRRP
jgi:DNA-directed RNA polymerase specialized sigma24 family protein